MSANTCPPLEASPPAALHLPNHLQAQLSMLAVCIEPPPVQEMMLNIFAELSNLIEYLRVVEISLRQDSTLPRSTPVFRLVREKALALVALINRELARTKGMTKSLREALGGTGFALRHELRRIYEGELAWDGNAALRQLSRAEATRAYGLLLNCFQQSTITLAQVFDPKLDGASLFDDLRVRREQSLALRRELIALYEHVQRAGREGSVLAHLSLVNHAKRFRRESMHHLMYKDWEEFESFVEEAAAACENLAGLEPVLHRFACYLQTLIQHVSMRSVVSGDSHAAAPACQD